MQPLQILQSIFRITFGVFESAKEDLVAIELTPRSFLLLAKVQKFPYPAQLAERLFLPAPTVTFMVKQLEKQGLIKREGDANDLRRYRLSLTKKGAESVEKGKIIADTHMRMQLKKLSKKDQDEFQRLLSELSE